MIPFFAICLIGLFGGLIGYSILPVIIDWDSGFESDSFEFLLLLPAAGLILFGWFAILLAELSIFALWSLVIVTILFIVVGFAISYYRYGTDSFLLGWNMFQRLNWQQPVVWRNGLPNGSELLFIGLCFLVLIPLYMRPHRMISGAADVGVYINLAAYLERTGGLIVENEILADLPADLLPGFLRQMPESAGGYDFWSSGLTVPHQSGRIIPPFYHLQSVWQAIGIALGGLQAGFLVTPMWGLLSNLMVYAVIRRLMQRHGATQWIALLTFIALATTTLQVWFSRYGTAEALTQFLIWAGLWGFIRWIEGDYKSYVWGGLAGIAWGMTFLARIDTFFILAVPGILLLLLIAQRNWHRSQLAFFVPLIILPIHSVLHALTFSEPYFYIIFGYVFLVAGIYLPLLIVAGLVFLILFWFVSGRWELPKSLGSAGKFLLVAIFAGFFLYNLWLRPGIGDMVSLVNPWDNIVTQHWNHENLIRLKWYLSPIGLWGAFLGIIYLIFNLKEKNWPLLALGLMFTFLYIWDIRSNGIHIYSQRRYVPMVIPFFIVATGLFLNRFAPRLKRLSPYLLPLICVIWLAGLWSSSLFYSRQADFRGIPTQVEAMADSLPENSILLFNQKDDISVGDFLAVPLFFIHGHDGFVMRHLDRLEPEQLEALLAEWDDAGREIFWVAQGDGYPWPLDEGILKLEGQHIFDTTQLESVPDRRPTEILPIVWIVDVYRVNPR